VPACTRSWFQSRQTGKESVREGSEGPLAATAAVGGAAFFSIVKNLKPLLVPSPTHSPRATLRADRLCTAVHRHGLQAPL
jgi:hypothetical protein